MPKKKITLEYLAHQIDQLRKEVVLRDFYSPHHRLTPEVETELLRALESPMQEFTDQDWKDIKAKIARGK